MENVFDIPHGFEATKNVCDIPHDFEETENVCDIPISDFEATEKVCDVIWFSMTYQMILKQLKTCVTDQMIFDRQKRYVMSCGFK